MRPILRLYDGVITGLAVVAGLMLVWRMVAIVWSVSLRSPGMQAHARLFTSTEYTFLYMTMLGAPWLVRKRGHVHIELLTAILPEAVRQVVSRLVALTCVVVCAWLAYRGVLLVQTNIARNDFHVRAYYFPRWMLRASPFPSASA